MSVGWHHAFLRRPGANTRLLCFVFFFYLVDIPEATPRSQGLPASPQPSSIPPPQCCHCHRPDEAAPAEEQILHPAHEHRSHDLLQNKIPVPAGSRWLSLPPSNAWHDGSPALYCRQRAGVLHRARVKPSNKLLFHGASWADSQACPGACSPASGCSSSALPAAHTAALSFLAAYINLR